MTDIEPFTFIINEIVIRIQYEIQLWCGKDYNFNIWSHKHTYKYKDKEIGKKLYHLYIQGEINSEDEFISRLEEVEK